MKMKEKVARPERLELPTLWFEARCSIQLSYGRTAMILHYLAIFPTSAFLHSLCITGTPKYKSENPLDVRLARSIKEKVNSKYVSGDWKERGCSLCFPAQVMLRGSWVFALRRSILFS